MTDIQTIREALILNGYPDEDTVPCPVAALDALDARVAALETALGQIVDYAWHPGQPSVDVRDIARAALAAPAPKAWGPDHPSYDEMGQ